MDRLKSGGRVNYRGERRANYSRCKIQMSGELQAAPASDVFLRARRHILHCLDGCARIWHFELGSGSEVQVEA